MKPPNFRNKTRVTVVLFSKKPSREMGRGGNRPTGQPNKPGSAPAALPVPIRTPRNFSALPGDDCWITTPGMPAPPAIRDRTQATNFRGGTLFGDQLKNSTMYRYFQETTKTTNAPKNKESSENAPGNSRHEGVRVRWRS